MDWRLAVRRRRSRGGSRNRLGLATVERIVLTLNRAFKMGTGFDRDCLVDDVTLDTGSRRQAHLKAAHTANDTAIHDNIVCHHFALDRCAFANGQQVGANVTFDSALDIDVAGRLEVSGDVQIARQDRRRRLCLGR